MKYNNQKGQIALIITLVVMSVMLMVGLSLSEMSFKQTRITADAYQSVQAYCLADSGTEHIMYEIFEHGLAPCPPTSSLPVLLIPETTPPDKVSFAGGFYHVNLTGCAPKTVIKISGVFKETNRAIQISYTP